MPKIDNYYNRFDESKNYVELLFRDGYGAQGEEQNEQQAIINAKIAKLARALFKDGDVVQGAQIVVDSANGHISATTGDVFLNGFIWTVPTAEFDIPVTGLVSVGVRLEESIISELEDPGLRNPARGQRSEGEPGAWRRKVEAFWGYDGDGKAGTFYPVYTIEDGQLAAKEAPPNLESFNIAIARYDRDSTGDGSYVSRGMVVSVDDALADGAQIFSVAEGRARVNGEGVELIASRRLRYPAEPDLRYIDTEVITAGEEESQRVNVAHAPVRDYVNLRVTQRKTVELTHGNYSGCSDALPDTSVLNIVSVKQLDTTYEMGTDFVRAGDTIDWSPSGAEPATGSTYSVTYDFLNTNVEPIDPDFDGFTVKGAVPGSSIMISYNQALPRVDRLCIGPDGGFSWVKGVAAEYGPREPQVPGGILALCSVYQNWRGAPEVVNDSARVFTFSRILAIEERVEYCLNEVARNRLEMNVGTREAGNRVGLFVDPLLDDSMRDQGIVQTAAIVDGALVLPISATALDVSADIATPKSVPALVEAGVSQLLKTSQMKVNPYMAFDIPEGKATISPSVDRWTETKTNWASTVTKTFYSSSNQTVRKNGGTTSNASQAGSTSSTSSHTSTSTSSSTQNLGTKTSALQYLRSINIRFTLENFAPGEILDSVNFGGVMVSFTGSKVADANGRITGSFTIPPKTPAGVKQIEFKGKATKAYATFTGQGTLQVMTLRRVQNIYRHTTTTTTITTTTYVAPVRVYNPDPLAQSFTLETEGQLAGVDLWFAARGTTNAQVQVREMDNGFPTSVVLAEAIVPPEKQIVGGGGHTRVMFDAPLPLEAGTEYAIVILCNDATTSLSIATMGNFDAGAQQYVTQQPYTVGLMLSSSNATTWTPHQDSDLAFRLLMAKYSETETTIDLGTVDLPEGTTDIVLMGLAELPNSGCRSEFVIELPDGATYSVAGEQGLRLPKAVSGEARIRARLFGNSISSPVLWPGTQIISGQMALTADYCTRSIVARDAVKAVLVYDGYVPSGSSVKAQIQIDSGEWQDMPLDKTVNQGDGIVEYRYEQELSGASLVKAKIILSGTPQARPEVYDIRFMAVE